MLSTIFNRPLNTVRLAIKTFTDLDMIEINNDEIIAITNWEKHQNIEGMEKIREQNRIRQQKHRKTSKQLPETANNVTSRDNHATDKNRIDKKRLEENRKEESAHAQNTPPFPLLSSSKQACGSNKNVFPG